MLHTLQLEEELGWAYIPNSKSHASSPLYHRSPFTNSNSLHRFPLHLYTPSLPDSASSPFHSIPLQQHYH